MSESLWTRIGLRVATGVVLAFLYLPLIILIIYAFNPSRLQAWPPTGLTLHWFAETAANPGVRDALVNSLLAGLGATGIALVLGTLAALAVHRFGFFGRETISFLFVLPIALPGVVTGIALRTTFQTAGVDFGLFTIIVGHATFCVVIAYNNVIARLRRLPRTPEEASADLGADTWTTFRRITLPSIGTALLSGGLLAFALSFDEIIVTNFTAGPGTETIPMWILGAIRRPTELPVVNVVAFILIIVSVVPVYLAQRISGAAGGGGRY
ncbi:MAG: ABC transporter permease [Chloroflexota bacterium]|jgi:putative spermidine/putrescine transport system permease protein|nr:ABC transporter permease [Chloroflexota bacterium]